LTIFFQIFEFDDIRAIQHYKLRPIFVYNEYQRNEKYLSSVNSKFIECLFISSFK
jgi:hypothetical protein